MSKLAEKIKAAPLKTVEADCPEWSELAGETLYVRELTGSEREQWEAKLFKGRNKDGAIDASVMPKLRNELVAACLVDGSGELVFDSPADVAELSGDTVARVGTQVMKVSGLVPDDVEELAGN